MLTPPAPAWPPTAQHLVLEVQKTPSRKPRRPTDGEAVAGIALADGATVMGAAPRSICGSGESLGLRRPRGSGRHRCLRARRTSRLRRVSLARTALPRTALACA